MNNLKFLRTYADVTLRDVAKHTNIVHSTVGELENEKRPFRETHIEALCDFFNCSSDFLLGKTKDGIYIETKQGVKSLTREEYVTYRLDGKISEYIQSNKIYRIPNDVLEVQLAPANDGSLVGIIINEIKEMPDTDLLKILKFIKEFLKNDS